MSIINCVALVILTACLVTCLCGRATGNEALKNCGWFMALVWWLLFVGFETGAKWQWLYVMNNYDLLPKVEEVGKP